MTDAPAAGRRSTWRTVLAGATTALAALLVYVALVAPADVTRLDTLAAFVRLPIEAVLGGLVLLVLPERARRISAAAAGVALGVLTVLKVLDMGFQTVLARPFDPVLDWVMLDDGLNFVTGAYGTAGAIGVVVTAITLAAAVIGLMTLAVLRLSRLAAGHRIVTGRVAAAGAVAWLTCLAIGAQLVPAMPIASRSAVAALRNQAVLVASGLQDQQEFARLAAVDAFRDAPADDLLTALRGKDVVFAVVESYGRSVVEDPAVAPGVGALLDDGTGRLAAAGFDTRSAYLTSSTAGGGSWLAHSTYQSGLWIDNEQRYRNLVASNRLTLTGAFRRAGWETVAVAPGTTEAWPEGEFFGYERVLDGHNLGYRGPNFSWSPMPDQYTLAAFERLARAQPDRGPLMAEISLVSSHAPWTPIPQMIGWDAIGDGSVYTPMAVGGGMPELILSTDPAQVRADYGKSIEYSMNSLISYVETYGDDDLVLVVFGDHQPAPVVTGADASRDVPITIVTRDQAVLDRIGDWGWQDGMRPGTQAPVWGMDAFRDRFLTAFSQPGTTQPQH